MSDEYGQRVIISAEEMDAIRAEVDAIYLITQALAHLRTDAKQRVVNYVKAVVDKND